MKRPLSVRTFLLGSLVALGAIATPKDAEASGYLTARYGSDYGTPAMPNTFGIYFNPAALGGTKGTTIQGDLSAAMRLIRYTRTQNALSPSDPSFLQDPKYVSANTGTANLTNFLALPFLGVNTDFGTQNLHAGWAAYIPFGGQADFTRRMGTPGVPGSTDGPQRWGMISGQLLAIYNTFAVAYRIEPIHLSIGASVSPIIHKISSTVAKNADGSDDTISPASGQVIEGRTYVDATGFNVGASVGLYWEPTEELHFGLSYLSQPGFGETRMSGTLRTQFGSGQESKANVDFLQTYPDLVRFGATYQATPRLMIRGDLEYTRWSVLDRQCIVEKGADCAVDADGRRQAGPAGQRVHLNLLRNWHDTIGVRVGPQYEMWQDVQAFGSLGFATAATPGTTIDAATVDSQQLYLTFGVHWAASRHWTLAGSYNHIYFVPVNTKGTNNADLANHPASSPGGSDYNVSRSPSGDGRYNSQIGFLNVNVAYTF